MHFLSCMSPLFLCISRASIGPRSVKQPLGLDIFTLLPSYRASFFFFFLARVFNISGIKDIKFKTIKVREDYWLF